MNTDTINSETCLCGSGQEYSTCCAPYHNEENNPSTALELMRSRFTAYALRNARYLMASWDSSKRPAQIDFSKETAEWQRLEILNCKKGSSNDSKGLVEFKAFYKQDDEDCFMHEISRFVKKEGRWFYLDGVIKAAGKTAANSVNTGRNALCGCGSGKKFKRCCGS